MAKTNAELEVDIKGLKRQRKALLIISLITIATTIGLFITPVNVNHTSCDAKINEQDLTINDLVTKVNEASTQISNLTTSRDTYKVKFENCSKQFSDCQEAGRERTEINKKNKKARKEKENLNSALDLHKRELLQSSINNLKGKLSEKQLKIQHILDSLEKNKNKKNVLNFTGAFEPDTIYSPELQEKWQREATPYGRKGKKSYLVPYGKKKKVIEKK